MFKIKLSPESRARLDAETAELSRLYTLTNEWLAHALLKLARMAQKATPEHTPDAYVYNSRLIYGVLPEISRRLGTVNLHLAEIDWEMQEKSDYELRLQAGYCLQNIGDSRLPGWNLLTSEPANGNPVVFAIDRLCAGVLGDKEDVLVTRMTEIAHHRNVHYTGVWAPSILKYA
ncbi:MAG: hypothetical protein Q7S87_10095 [Agitococcus sp.]|nr:hypothetical protein [Agitococcus sp.]